MGKNKQPEPVPMPEFDLNYFRMLLNESDRSCVLLTTARLDELLEALHRSHIRSKAAPPDKFVKELFAVHAPLSTLSAKIKLALAYGLISQDDFFDLELLRGMRNDAAHTVADFAFDLPEISKKVAAFTAPKRLSNHYPAIAPTATKRQFLANPPADKPTTKLYFLTAGMYLCMVLLDTIAASLRCQWSTVKAVATEAPAVAAPLRHN